MSECTSVHKLKVVVDKNRPGDAKQRIGARIRLPTWTPLFLGKMTIAVTGRQQIVNYTYN